MVAGAGGAGGGGGGRQHPLTYSVIPELQTARVADLCSCSGFRRQKESALGKSAQQ